jgi:hypothetical protein
MPDPIPSNSAIIQADQSGAYNPGQYGVFALHPLMTPKYALGKPRDGEFKDTLARMYVDLGSTDDKVKQAYLQSLPGDAQTQALAQILIGAGQKVQTGFIDFFLSQVQEQFSEKVQVDQVLGDNYVAFYFGQEPPVFTYSGNLLNSQQDDQRTGFGIAYQQILRGTQLGRRGALLRLKYDSVIVSGTLNSQVQVLNADNELIIPFNFTLLVKEYIVVNPPRYVKTSLADFVQLATQFAAPGVLTQVGQSTDARVRTTMILPSTLAASPVVGSEEDGTVVLDTSQPAPQQLVQKATQVTTPPPPTSNILGTVSQSLNPPPAPNASGL